MPMPLRNLHLRLLLVDKHGARMFSRLGFTVLGYWGYTVCGFTVFARSLVCGVCAREVWGAKFPCVKFGVGSLGA